MNRVLLPSTAFLRAARKVGKGLPQKAAAIEAALELLTADAFDPRLRPHKLSGELAVFRLSRMRHGVERRKNSTTISVLSAVQRPIKRDL
jgi:hypothetical protein